MSEYREIQRTYPDSLPSEVLEILDHSKAYVTNEGLQVIVTNSKEDGYHISLNHDRRDVTKEEIIKARHFFIPDDIEVEEYDLGTGVIHIRQKEIKNELSNQSR